MKPLSYSHTYSTDVWHLEILYMDSQDLEIQNTLDINYQDQSFEQLNTITSVQYFTILV